MTTTTETGMNARKYAWQILHAEIRRRAGADEGLDFHPQLERIGLLWREASDQNISKLEIACELAGFGATFALMTQNDPLGVATRIGEQVMSEPDDDDDL